MTDATESTPPADVNGSPVSGHAGELAVAAARPRGVETMFALSGAHVFPI